MNDANFERALLADIERFVLALNRSLAVAFDQGLRVTVNTHAQASLRGGPERLSLKVWKPLLEVPPDKSLRIVELPAGGKDSTR